MSTPIYDELISKLEIQSSSFASTYYKCSKNNQDLFWSYVEKVGNRQLFKEPTNPSTSGVGGPEAQPLCFTNGVMNGNYLRAFEKFELQQMYKKLAANAKVISNAEYKKAAANRKAKWNENTKAAADMKIARNAQEAEMRFRQNLRGPLINMNTPHPNKQENLLSFEPTKQGLNNRGKELEGLFGGRRTRRRRGQKKRKTRRFRR